MTSSRTIALSLDLERPLDGSLAASGFFRRHGATHGDTIGFYGLTEGRGEQLLRWVAQHRGALLPKRVRRFTVGLERGNWGDVGVTPMGVLWGPVLQGAGPKGGGHGVLDLGYCPEPDEGVVILAGRYVIHHRLGVILRPSRDELTEVRAGDAVLSRWSGWLCKREEAILQSDPLGVCRFLGLWVAGGDSIEGVAADATRHVVPVLGSSDPVEVKPVVLGVDVVDSLRAKGPYVAPIFEPDDWPVAFARRLVREVEGS